MTKHEIPSPVPQVGDHHDRMDAEVADVERTLTAQLSAVRTARMQHQIAGWLHEAESSGVLGPDARTLALLRHDESVNEFGSVCLTVAWVEDEAGEAVDDDNLPELSIDLHADSSGPDLYAPGWVDEHDKLDLDKVRAWSASQESRTVGRA